MTASFDGTPIVSEVEEQRAQADLDDSIDDDVLAGLLADPARTVTEIKGPRSRPRMGKRLRFTILTRDGFRCRYCGATGGAVVLHVDHVVPVSRGGTNDEKNLVTSCRDCNLGKAASRIEPLKPQPPMCRFMQVKIDPVIEPIERPAALYWLGDQWKVTSDGIDTVDDRYFIEAHRIWEDEDRYGWLRHMSEKQWVDIVEFEKALLFARRLFVFTPAGRVQDGRKRRRTKS